MKRMMFRFTKSCVADSKQQIANARRLLGEYNPCNPERDKPSTTVHLLVEQLLRFER
jgi:hypothetical protein